MRTDAQIQRDVTDELGFEPSVHAAHIGVAVEGGIVTLTGHVTSCMEKWSAGRAAKRVAGVKAVANDVEVRVLGQGRRDDTDIAGAAVLALEWDTAVPHHRVQVAVDAGWVTLEGRVDWKYQSDAAEADIRRLAGVRGVTNSIEVEWREGGRDLKAQIERAFGRAAGLASAPIHVEASNGKVALHGHVRSWADRDEAERTAWAAPGVVAVENDLSVSD
jgi:osmotically-inducible protein OsmY